MRLKDELIAECKELKVKLKEREEKKKRQQQGYISWLMSFIW